MNSIFQQGGGVPERIRGLLAAVNSQQGQEGGASVAVSRGLPCGSVLVS